MHLPFLLLLLLPLPPLLSPSSRSTLWYSFGRRRRRRRRKRKGGREWGRRRELESRWRFLRGAVPDSCRSCRWRSSGWSCFSTVLLSAWTLWGSSWNLTDPSRIIDDPGGNLMGLWNPSRIWRSFLLGSEDSSIIRGIIFSGNSGNLCDPSADHPFLQGRRWSPAGARPFFRILSFFVFVFANCRRILYGRSPRFFTRRNYPTISLNPPCQLHASLSPPPPPPPPQRYLTLYLILIIFCPNQRRVFKYPWLLQLLSLFRSFFLSFFLLAFCFQFHWQFDWTRIILNFHRDNCEKLWNFARKFFVVDYLSTKSNREGGGGAADAAPGTPPCPIKPIQTGQFRPDIQSIDLHVAQNYNRPTETRI